MDIPEQKYRTLINRFRPHLYNLLAEYPIAHNRQLPSIRNLKYLTNKAELGADLPYTHELNEQIYEQIKHSISDGCVQVRMLGVRLARSLPFTYRIKLVEQNQNELSQVIAGKKDVSIIPSYEYSFEMAADISELLLSVYELTHQYQDVYFDVNQKIVSLFSRLIQFKFSGERTLFRNGCQILRNIFICFGTCVDRQNLDNKLLSKLVSTFTPFSSFVTKQQQSMSFNSSMISQRSNRSNHKLTQLIFQVREFQIRMRPRLYFGFCCILTYLHELDAELVAYLSKQIFLVLDNINECDVNLQSFGCLQALLQQDLPFHTRNSIIKKWVSLLSQISYKKQYLEFYIFLLSLTVHQPYQIPYKLKYFLSITFLQLTKNIQQQYTRFLIMSLCCSNIMDIARHSYGKVGNCSVLLNIFQYSWFIDRINMDSELFKSQFLICLLHGFFRIKGAPPKSQITDLLGLCHRLIDWKCTSKEQTHIPTLKFAFDLYLVFLSTATDLLGSAMETYIIELIERCNQQSIYFLFKLKLIGTIINLEWYRSNAQYLQKVKLNLDFIDGQIRPFMMPKNPKPIFDQEYSQSIDGQIQSRKQIQSIKIINNLLAQLPKVHEQVQELSTTIQLQYQQYLTDLQNIPSCNRDLINCLQTVEADHYLSDCHRNFLLAQVIPAPGLHSLNYELNMDNSLLSSPYEHFLCPDEINIFGPMSPVQLTVRLVRHSSYTHVYIHLRKGQWVQVGAMRLLVSSGVEKKEVPFESGIIEMRIDRVGWLHFEVWTTEGTQLLVGSGNYQLLRRLQWFKVPHLHVIDGIRTKAYFKNQQKPDPDCTYLSYYYGQPLLLQLLKSSNQIVVSVPNKQIWNEMREVIASLIEQLAEDAAEILE